MTMESVQQLINLFIAMQKMNGFSVYRTRFKFKFKINSKKTPSKQPQKQSCRDCQSANNNPNVFTRSPYGIKYARNHQSAKGPRTVAEKEPNNEDNEDRPLSEIRIRLKSSPQRQNKFEEIFEKQKTEQSPVDLSKSHLVKSNILRESFVRSASRRKLNILRQLSESKKSLSKRKFTVSVVNLKKQDEKSRHKIDKKLEAYDYKRVLGDPLPFNTKKLPRLVISKQGVVRLQRN